MLNGHYCNKYNKIGSPIKDNNGRVVVNMEKAF